VQSSWRGAVGDVAQLPSPSDEDVQKLARRLAARIDTLIPAPTRLARPVV
jgi:hypothetical protein